MKMVQYITDISDPIFNEVMANFVMLSQTEKGLNVVKELIALLSDSKAQLQIVDMIVKNAQSYIENQYSNYATQLIVKKWSVEVTRPLFLSIIGKVRYYSMQKCSSNVVEAFLYNAPEEFKVRYIDELAHSKNLTGTRVISDDGECVRLFCSSENG